MREKRRSGSHPPSLLLILSTSSFSFLFTITRREWLDEDWLDLRLDSWKWDGVKRKTGERLNEKRREIELRDGWMRCVGLSNLVSLSFVSTTNTHQLTDPIFLLPLSSFSLSFSRFMLSVLVRKNVTTFTLTLFTVWLTVQPILTPQFRSLSLPFFLVSFLQFFLSILTFSSTLSLSLLPILDLNQDRKIRRET